MNEVANGRTEISSFVESALVESYSKILVVNINNGEFEIYKNDGFLMMKALTAPPTFMLICKSL